MTLAALLEELNDFDETAWQDIQNYIEAVA